MKRVCWPAFLLGLSHVYSILYWWIAGAHVTFSRDYNAICWPFFEGCQVLHVLPLGAVPFLMAGLALLGVAAMFVAWRKPEKAKWLVCVLAVALVYKSLMMLMEYRLRLNQHYMIFWLHMAFFVSVAIKDHAHKLFKLALVMFYFWAGILKFDVEWLSGHALYGKPWLVPEVLIPTSLYYVLILEVFLIWGLWSRNAKLRFAVLVQLILFHITSYTVVGWFYPTLMMSFLLIFVLDGEDKQFLFLDLKRKAFLAATAVFAALQIYPMLLPGDSSLTGQGRNLALHMFDARAECDSQLTWTMGEGKKSLKRIEMAASTRMRCLPYIHLFEIQHYFCPQLMAREGFLRAHWSFKSKKSYQTDYTLVAGIEGICRNPVVYKSFWINDWLQTRPEPN